MTALAPQVMVIVGRRMIIRQRKESTTLTVREAAEKLGWPVNRTYEAVARGDFPNAYLARSSHNRYCRREVWHIPECDLEP